jgi:hypothetical protein
MNLKKIKCFSNLKKNEIIYMKLQRKIKKEGKASMLIY